MLGSPPLLRRYRTLGDRIGDAYEALRQHFIEEEQVKLTPC